MHIRRLAAADDATGSVRALILRFVAENPGTCLQEIADSVGYTRTAAVHHVRRLVNQDRLVTVRKGRRVLHFTPNQVKPQERNIFALLRIQRVRLLVEALREDPTASWRSLARRLSVTPHTVRWHMKRLHREGIVRIEEGPQGDGRLVTLHPDLHVRIPEGAAQASAPFPPQPAGASIVSGPLS